MQPLKIGLSPGRGGSCPYGETEAQGVGGCIARGAQQVGCSGRAYPPPQPGMAPLGLQAETDTRLPIPALDLRLALPLVAGAGPWQDP